MLKPLTVWTEQTGKILKEKGILDHLTWETCMQDKKQQLEHNMEQQTGSELEKEYVKAVYCHSAYLTYMQSTSWEVLGWMITGWNQDCWGKYQQPHIGWWYHSNGRKQRGTEEPLDEGERGEWKSWLKSQHSKTKIMASSPITSWQIVGETVTDFIFFGSKITVDGDYSHKIKRHSLGEKLWET